MDENISMTYRLTRHLVWSSEETVKLRNMPLPAELDAAAIANHNFLLGIYALSKDFLKVTSYFLDTSEVAKITFVFDKIDDDIVKKVSLVIKDIPNSPIHVSGFCMKRDRYVYEMYIKGTTEEATRIVALVQKHASSFQTCIEEIPLKSFSGATGKRAAKPVKPAKKATHASGL